MIEYLEPVSVVLAGAAAAMSVLYAVKTFRRHEREKLIDSNKISAVNIKSKFKELDRLVSAPFFMEVAERYANRLSKVSGAVGDVEKLTSFLRHENSRPTLHRELTQAVNDAAGVERSREIITDLNKELVSVSQNFPISASMISSAVRISENVVHALTSTSTFSSLLSDGELEENIQDSLDKHQSYEHFLAIFSAVISDPAMRYLNDNGQKVIDICEIVIDRICDNLTDGEFRSLLEQQKSEIAEKERVSKASDLLEELQLGLGVVGRYMKESDRDDIVTSIGGLGVMGQKE